MDNTQKLWFTIAAVVIVAVASGLMWYYFNVII